MLGTKVSFILDRKRSNLHNGHCDVFFSFPLLSVLHIRSRRSTDLCVVRSSRSNCKADRLLRPPKLSTHDYSDSTSGWLQSNSKTLHRSTASSILQAQSHLTGIFHYLSDMSHSRMAGHRSASTETAPFSVNYVLANTEASAQSKPKPKPTSTSPPATTLLLVEKQGKRSRLRSKVKKAFTSFKTNLKTVSAICFPKDNNSNSSVKSRDSYQNSVRVSLISRTSTPSICLTKPTHRGANVRLTLHQVPPSREPSRTTYLDEAETSQSAIDEAQTSLPAMAPSLPYIALAPAMVMEVGEATPRPEPTIQSPAHPVPATTSNAPTILNIPSILAPGSKQPMAKSRVRPHTTNEPTRNYLPFIPYNSRFNPYSAATTACNSPVTASTAQKKPSAGDLAAAFAKVEAAERATRHKRHTTLYAAVESGSLNSLIATTSLTATAATMAAAAATPPKAKASASTATATRTAPKAPSSKSAFAIKRKPVPKRADAAKHRSSRFGNSRFSTSKPSTSKPSTSKPLPAPPALHSPRRFTCVFAPLRLREQEGREQPVREQWAHLQSDRDGLPSQSQWKLSPAPRIVWWKNK